MAGVSERATVFEREMSGVTPFAADKRFKHP
jgi:hypothetical protein